MSLLLKNQQEQRSAGRRELSVLLMSNKKEWDLWLFDYLVKKISRKFVSVSPQRRFKKGEKSDGLATGGHFCTNVLTVIAEEKYILLEEDKTEVLCQSCLQHPSILVPSALLYVHLQTLQLSTSSAPREELPSPTAWGSSTSPSQQS